MSVAVPVPALDLLTYRLPDAAAAAGGRAPASTCRSAPRRVTGIVVEAPVGRAGGAGAAARRRSPCATARRSCRRALLALARWVADYYLAGPGDVLATALPPRVLTGDERTFRRRRVAALTAAGVHAAEQAGDRPALRAAGRRRRRRAAPRPPPARGADRCWPGRRPAWPAATLADRGITAATLARLVQSGLVAVRHEAVDRDPFAAHAFTLPAPAPPPTLTGEQQAALDVLDAAGRRRRVSSAALLRGVTGSGKTEIYLHLADHVRRQGRQALLLVPEIALTPAVAGRVRARFGERVAIQHSGLSDGERHDQWHRVRGGEVDVVVGTRSAVFAPLDRLGLVVVDEEHDTSYKQDETPRYHGRDVAVMRAHAGRARWPCSARRRRRSRRSTTPQRGRYTAGRRSPAGSPTGRWPTVRVVNMREEWAEAGAGSDPQPGAGDGDRRAARRPASRAWCCSTAAASPRRCCAGSAARRSSARTAASR